MAYFLALKRQKAKEIFGHLDFFKFLQNMEKPCPGFWICCSLSYFGELNTKSLAGAVGAHPFLAPRSKAPKTTILPILRRKILEIQNFFLLQISLFIGPIDGINNNFLLGLPFWGYGDFSFWARILDPNFQMATVPKRLGAGPKFFHQADPHAG